jgi:hypothetical protein
MPHNRMTDFFVRDDVAGLDMAHVVGSLGLSTDPRRYRLRRTGIGLAPVQLIAHCDAPSACGLKPQWKGARPSMALCETRRMKMGLRLFPGLAQLS